MNYKSILFYLGVFSLLVTFFSILNILYSIYFDFILDLNTYLSTCLISALTGSLFCYIGHKHYRSITLIDQIAFILSSFILIPIFISIPYYFSIYNISLINSYFESVSGFTATGFSILENVDGGNAFRATAVCP